MSSSIVFQSVFCSNRTAEYSDLQSTKELLTWVLAQEPGKPKGMAQASSQLLMGSLDVSQEGRTHQYPMLLWELSQSQKKGGKVLTPPNTQFSS